MLVILDVKYEPVLAKLTILAERRPNTKVWYDNLFVLLPYLQRKQRKYGGNVDGAGGRRDESLALVAVGRLASAR